MINIWSSGIQQDSPVISGINLPTKQHYQLYFEMIIIEKLTDAQLFDFVSEIT